MFRAHLSKNAIGIHQNTKHLRSPALPMLPLITTSHILQQSLNDGENKLIQSNQIVPSIHTMIGSTPVLESMRAREPGLQAPSNLAGSKINNPERPVDALAEKHLSLTD